jgi:hypothetical protein
VSKKIFAVVVLVFSVAVTWLLRNNRFNDGIYPLHDLIITLLLTTILLALLMLIYFYIDESDRLKERSIAPLVMQFFFSPLLLFLSIKRLSGVNHLPTLDFFVLSIVCLVSVDATGHIRRGLRKVARPFRPEHYDRDLYHQKEELDRWSFIIWCTVILIILSIASGV